VPLGVHPTPVVRARRLERALGCGPLLVKRDDLIGFGAAGNKTRPLEFLLADALAHGAEVLVTGGGAKSNFCPAAALAARICGLDCEILVPGEPVGPNVALAVAAGARVLPIGDIDRHAIDEAVARRAAELEAAGRRAYGVPRGGSTPLGAVGFAVAAAEMVGQLDELPAVIVLPVGSGGSCAGLIAGLAAIGADVPVLGVSVSRPLEDIRRHVHELAAGCAQLLARHPPAVDADLLDRAGQFGTASAPEREWAALVLGTEGLLLDETYGAQTFTAAIDRACAGPGGPVLVWHTGGLVPAVDSISRTKGAA